jgi:acyl-CoA thioesterase
MSQSKKSTVPPSTVTRHDDAALGAGPSDAADRRASARQLQNDRHEDDAREQREQRACSSHKSCKLQCSYRTIRHADVNSRIRRPVNARLLRMLPRMGDSTDAEWLGLERHGGGRWSLELTNDVTRHDGKLFGGTGIAAMVATMEAETERDALWTTVQYAGSADLGERLDFAVDTLATGRRTSQVRMTATVGDRIVLAALGAAGAPRTGPIEAQIPTMPEVPAPDDCSAWAFGMPTHDAKRPRSWFELVDMRHSPDPAAPALWMRMRSGIHTRATIAFLADMVPSAVARAAGRTGGGTSLDNSLRYARFGETEWILLDMDPWFGTGGYLHGAARVWTEDGTLLGVASQTATAIVWDGEIPPWLDNKGG